MNNAMYVSLSAQIAHARRLDTIAANVANMSTAGYRAESVQFGAISELFSSRTISFVDIGAPDISTGTGALSQTGNPLDVAIKGNSWFGVRTPTGISYTRDGRLAVSESGELRTISGLPILDAGGGTIMLSPGASPPTIARDGMITQDGRQIGAIGLFKLPSDTALRRSANNSISSSKEGIPTLDFDANNIVQGFSESSNVEPLKEMSNLMSVQRLYDLIAGGMDMLDSTRTDAIKSLGQ